MNDSKIIYVAHPYGGDEDNLEKFDNLFSMIQINNQDTVFVSPLKLYTDLYEKMSYVDGVDLCLSLLYHCDELWLCGDWQSSKGCIAEYVYAQCNDIPIKYVAYDTWFNPIFVDKSDELTHYNVNTVFNNAMEIE